MTSIPHCILALEAYMERSGVRLERAALPDWIQGQLYRKRITLSTHLSPHQELVALVHELTHWLVHGDPPRCMMEGTLFEYEAEAVEALVMERLDLPHASVDAGAFRGASPTDNLLAASVARVKKASVRIFDALGVAAASASESQTSIDLEAATRKEIVFEYEHRGVGNFLGPPKAL